MEFLTEKPAFIVRKRSRGRFAVGMRYQRECEEHLSLFALGRPEFELRLGPWLQFVDQLGRRWCQPDALLAHPAEKHCWIIEIKYQHTCDAWYQLRQLYLPVLKESVELRGWTFNLLEMVHWFDPSLPWPETQLNVPTLGQRWSADLIGTLIFNKRRERRLQEARHSGGESAGETARPLWPAEGTE